MVKWKEGSHELAVLTNPVHSNRGSEMIRKYLVCGKTLYLQSRPHEVYRDMGHVHELLLPIRTFWEIEDILGQINYKIAAGASVMDVEHSYKQIYRMSARFALFEMSRAWLHRKGQPDR